MDAVASARPVPRTGRGARRVRGGTGHPDRAIRGEGRMKKTMSPTIRALACVGLVLTALVPAQRALASWASENCHGSSWVRETWKRIAGRQLRDASGRGGLRVRGRLLQAERLRRHAAHRDRRGRRRRRLLGVHVQDVGAADGSRLPGRLPLLGTREEHPRPVQHLGVLRPGDVPPVPVDLEELLGHRVHGRARRAALDLGSHRPDPPGGFGRERLHRARAEQHDGHGAAVPPVSLGRGLQSGGEEELDRGVLPVSVRLRRFSSGAGHIRGRR